MLQLSSLPEDVIFIVFKYLKVEDIVAIGQTCSNMRKVTMIRHVWIELLGRKACNGDTSIDLPFASRPLIDLSSLQLQGLVRYAYNIRNKLHSGTRPKCAVKLDRMRGVTWVHILNGQWVLTAASDSSISELSLWSIRELLSAPTKLHPVAPTCTSYLTGPVACGLVDLHDERAILALEIRSPQPFVQILGISIQHGMPVFVVLARLPGVSRLRCLVGPLLGYALSNEISLPCVLNWRTQDGVHLRDRPDITGGCICMAIRDDLVAVLLPSHLEVYILTSSHEDSGTSYRRLSRMKLPRPVLDASLTFVNTSESSLTSGVTSRPLCALRLCLVDAFGLSVYDAVVSADGSKHTLHETWTHTASDRHGMCRPHFGKRPDTISWFGSVQRRPWSHMFHATVTIPVPASLPTTTHHPVVYTIQDPDMPALHCAGVSDQDETLGLLVVGSGYGELTLYSLCKCEASVLASGLRAVAMPPAGDNELLPAVPVPSLAALPYPASLFAPNQLPSTQFSEATMTQWRAKQSFDGLVPEGWITEFLHPPYGDIRWFMYLGSRDSGIGWELENVAHYLGTIDLLLYHLDERLSIFAAGGLLFLCSEEAEAIWVVNDGVSATQLALAVNERRVAELLPHQVCSEGFPSSKETYLEFILWQWEKHKLGRNRWAELKERGGEVGPEWLGDKPFVNLKSLE